MSEIARDLEAHDDLAHALSVVMPVHNALPHLDEAIQSILGQTFRDFEFIILDDASTDGSWERLQEWAARDSRIRLLHADQNLGPVGSSNMVAGAAKANLVARMDADDVSAPDRLAEQIRVFGENPDIGVVGSLAEMIDASGRVLRRPEAWRISRQSAFVPFAHGVMMYRRSLYERVGAYREECAYWEDQDLIVRMAAFARVMVIPRSLYKIRAWARSTRVASESERIERSLGKMYAVTDQLRRKGRYELLKSDTTVQRIDPRVFMAMGSVRLWAGERPRLFLRLLRRGHLSLNFKTLSAVVWVGWASISPASLRAFLKLLLDSRNRVTSRYASGAAVNWQPLKREYQFPADEPQRPRSAGQTHRRNARN